MLMVHITNLGLYGAVRNHGYSLITFLTQLATPCEPALLYPPKKTSLLAIQYNHIAVLRQQFHIMFG